MPFGRFEHQESQAPLSDINVTPMVDVMLVLVVIFIITAPLMAQTLKLNLPEAELPPLASAQASLSLQVSINAQGAVFLQNKALNLEELSTAFEQALVETNKRQPIEVPELQLKADAQVPYGRVVEIMGLAQKAGLTRIGFVAQPKVAPAKP